MRCIAIGAAAALGLSAGALAQYDSGGFEGLMLGPLPGQDGWVEDSAPGQDDNGRPVNYPAVQVVQDPTGGGHGNVICFDPAGTGGGWQGVANAFGPTTLDVVVMEWDQWATDFNDNFWYADSPDFAQWWAIQWDTNSSAHAQTFDAGVPLTSQVWQHITYTYDFAAGTVTVDVDGTSMTHSPVTGPNIRGIAFEVEPGPFAGEGGPLYVDNFRVTQIPAPGAASVLALAGLALARRRR